jgi:Ca2+-transporting ATPase
MAACETMGGCTSVCSDKTGTLTENIMTVVDGFLGGKALEGVMPTVSKLSPKVVTALVEGAALNSKATIGADHGTGRPEIIGNRTEGALVLLLRSLQIDWREARESADVQKVWAFNSIRKSMATVVGTSGKKARVLIKGATEAILGQCTKYMGADGDGDALTEDLRKRILQYNVKMATRGLRTIALAQVEAASASSLDPDAPPSSGLTLVAIFGIQVEISTSSPETVMTTVGHARRLTIVSLSLSLSLSDNSFATRAGSVAQGSARSSAQLPGSWHHSEDGNGRRYRNGQEYSKRGWDIRCWRQGDRGV